MQPYFKAKKNHTKKHNKKRHRANHTKDIKMHGSIQETQPKQSIIIRMNNGILSTTKAIITGITSTLPQITLAKNLSEPNTNSTTMQPLQNATQEINTTVDSGNITTIQKILNSTQSIIADYLSDNYNYIQESEVRNPSLDEEYYDNYDTDKQVTEDAETNTSNNIGPVSTTAIIVPIVFISVAAATILFMYLSYKNDKKRTQTKNNRKEPNTFTEEEGKYLVKTKDTSSANKPNNIINNKLTQVKNNRKEPNTFTEEEGKYLVKTKDTSSANKPNNIINNKLTQQKNETKNTITSISETINEIDKAKINNKTKKLNEPIKKSEKSKEEIDNEINEAKIPGYSIGLANLYPAKIMTDKYFASKK